MTTDKETRIPFCAVPVAFGFAHLTDEGGEYESKEKRAYMYSRAWRWRYHKFHVLVERAGVPQRPRLWDALV